MIGAGAVRVVEKAPTSEPPEPVTLYVPGSRSRVPDIVVPAMEPPKYPSANCGRPAGIGTLEAWLPFGPVSVIVPALRAVPLGATPGGRSPFSMSPGLV